MTLGLTCITGLSFTNTVYYYYILNIYCSGEYNHTSPPPRENSEIREENSKLMKKRNKGKNRKNQWKNMGNKEIKKENKIKNK